MDAAFDGPPAAPDTDLRFLGVAALHTARHFTGWKPVPQMAEQ